MVDRSKLAQQVFKRMTVPVLVILLLSTIVLAQETVSGRATVRDGDDLVVNGLQIRLFGVDAFELNQKCQLDGKSWACGRVAKQKLEELVAKDEVRCVGAGKTTRDRRVMRCYIGDKELNAEMVALGLALDCPAYSKELYKKIEAQAKEQRKGAWAGEFLAPWQAQGKTYCCTSAHQRSFCP